MTIHRESMMKALTDVFFPALCALNSDASSNPAKTCLVL